MCRKNQQRGAYKWTSFLSKKTSKVNKNSEGYFENELNQLILNIQDINNIQDSNLTQLYKSKAFTIELKKKFADSKLGTNEHTLLHLAAEFSRRKFFSYLVQDFKMDKDCHAKDKSTPIHCFIQNNIIIKENYIQESFESTLEQTSFEKQISQVLDAKNDVEKHKLENQIQFMKFFNMLMKNLCNFNLKDQHGYSPLHLAVKLNNYVGVLHLLKVPTIDINIKDNDGLTPLHLACKYGCEDVADLLINNTDSNKLIVYILSECVKTSDLPLHLVCEKKKENCLIIKYYLEKIKKEQGNDLDQYKKTIGNILRKQDENKQTILHLAIENNHLQIVELLLRDFILSDTFKDDLREGSNGNLLIHSAAKTGSVEIFHLLQKYDFISFNTNNNSENALHIAASHNRREFIEEFLKYELFLIEKNTQGSQPTTSTSDTNKYDSNILECACTCYLDINKHVPTIKAKDSKSYTPLLTALASSNQKCVEELVDSSFVDLNAIDLHGNSIFHVCAQNDNVESLKYLIEKLNPKNDLNFYNIKNFNYETILHVSCFKGNKEITNLIMNKLHETKKIYDDLLFSKNKDGQNFFHVAVSKGYFNLVEYFIKKKKLIRFVKNSDNNKNSSLHLASMNGNLSIVNLLLEIGCDPNSRNDQNMTPLDLSCRMGNFEISKRLITHSNITDQKKLNEDGQYLLHLAALQGEHEIVELLLLKGAKIDMLNKDNMNCLDIAIEYKQRDVIKVLLDNKQWYKLMRTSEQNTFEKNEENDDFNILVVSNNKVDNNADNSALSTYSTLDALYKKKLWEIIKLILDKCKINENNMNFSIVDPPTKLIATHPLMLIAKSGQENLIKHDVTTLLLELKWRFLPRFIFYFNLSVYFLYLFLFSWYVVELSTNENDENDSIEQSKLLRNNTFKETNVFNNNKFQASVGLFKSRGFKINRARHRGDEDIKEKTNSTDFLMDLKETVIYHINNKSDSYLNNVLILIIMFQVLKELIILFYLDGFSYFSISQNFLEVSTYLFSLISLLSIQYHIQSNFGSVAILFAYILLPLFLQIFKSIGVYVITLKRTILNSTKLFPVFLILFTGFVLSFKLRTNFGVNYSESDSFGYSMIRTVTMVIGELDTSKMGLDHNDALPNLIIYFLFIGLMCTILLNLFVGIAVDDIKTILDEADIQLISMKIIYVLRIQKAFQPFFDCFCCFKNKLNISFKRYNKEDDNTIFKAIDVFMSKINNLISREDGNVELADPNKRLENNLQDMSREMNEKFENFKNLFSNRLNETESKLLNAQTRLQDSINEFSGITINQINTFREEMKIVNSKVNNDLDHLQKDVTNAKDDIAYTNKYFNSRLAESEQKFISQVTKVESILIEMTRKALFQFESVKESCITEPKNLKTVIINSEKLLEEFLADLIKSNQQNISLKDECLESFIQDQVIEKLIKPSNEELKSLINRMLEKTIDKFQLNETNFHIQKLQIEEMATNLKFLFRESIRNLKAENQIENEKMKNETVFILDARLNAIESSLKQLVDTQSKIFSQTE